MRILLTNDDGIHAEGLWVLYRHFSEQHDVTIVAPDRERSAVGHGITLDQPLRVHKVRPHQNGWGYAVNGTPVDCIKMAMLEILEKKPDIVISGINPGANVGVNLNYSGTVSAAKEAALYNVPSFAVSITGRNPTHYQTAAVFIGKIIKNTLKHPLPRGSFLNVNVPDVTVENVTGVKVSKQATRFFTEYIEKKEDPRNQPYYWQGCDSRVEDKDPETDCTVLNQNYVSVTPIKCDMTDYNLIDKLKPWEQESSH